MVTHWMIGRGVLWIPGVFFLLVVMVGLVVLAVWLINSNRSHGSRPPAARPMGSSVAGAEAILAERLAKGEIEVDDYNARIAALRQGGVTDA